MFTRLSLSQSSTLYVKRRKKSSEHRSIFEKRISIKGEIRQYLSQIFYEMNAFWPHDYRTYEHIRILSKDKLDIDVLKSHFPPQQIE